MLFGLLTAAGWVPLAPPPVRRAQVVEVGGSPAARPPIPPPHSASVIVPTHQDGDNIGALVERLLAEASVGEVIMVASGCADDTVVNALTAAGDSDRMRLFVEAERSGKDAAINLGLAEASCRYVVVVSGDVLPEPGAITRLVEALRAPGIGIAGGRPVPVNDPADFMGHVGHLLWDLHDRLARRQPKVGEVAALRADAVAELPPTSVDEACLQSLVEQAGWHAVYVPDARVRNRAPQTWRELVLQRRRVHAGHLALRHRHGHTVASLRVGMLVFEAITHLRRQPHLRRPRRLAWTAGGALLELYARILAHADHLRGREHHVWDIIESAKGLAARTDDPEPAGGGRVAALGPPPPAPDQRHGERDLPL